MTNPGPRTDEMVKRPASRFEDQVTGRTSGIKTKVVGYEEINHESDAETDDQLKTKTDHLIGKGGIAIFSVEYVEAIAACVSGESFEYRDRGVEGPLYRKSSPQQPWNGISFEQ